jgi:cytoskeleton protein RodZ
MTDKVSSSTVLELMARDLKSARIEKNLSLDDVSRQITIQKSYLEKIEEGDFAFLSRAYVFAYLKSYAQHLGVGNDESIEQCRKDLQISGSTRRAAVQDGNSGARQNERREPEINPGVSKLPKSPFSWKSGTLLAVFVVMAAVYLIGTTRFSVPPPAPPPVSLPSAAVEDTVAVAEPVIDSLVTTGEDKPPLVAASEHPASSIAPNSPETPVPQVTPVRRETPLSESKPVRRETPVLQATPAHRVPPLSQEKPVGQELPLPESKPVHRETSASKATPANRVLPLSQVKPALQEAPPPESKPVSRETSASQTTPVNRVPPLSQVKPVRQEPPLPESRPERKESTLQEATPAHRVPTLSPVTQARRDIRVPSATSASRDTKLTQVSSDHTALPKTLSPVRNKSIVVPDPPASNSPPAASVKSSRKSAEDDTSLQASSRNRKVLIVKVVKDFSWVKVVADDSAKVYPGGSFKSGQTLRYEARNKLWVNIGRPDYVELYLNGKKLPPSTSRILVFD